MRQLKLIGQMNVKVENENINSLNKLPLSFYEGNDVVQLAKALLGKVLVTNFDAKMTVGRIVETEAYNGHTDKASHAYNNKRTKRTEVMYANGGVAYVYLCYGIHQMFNIVTNEKDIPHAILIRAVEPMVGVETMLKRSFKSVYNLELTKGPGNVARSFGIHTNQSGTSLISDELFIADDHFSIDENEILATKRIGVDYAKDDADLLYRFFLKNNPFVSGKRSLNT